MGWRLASGSDGMGRSAREDGVFLSYPWAWQISSGQRWETWKWKENNRKTSTFSYERRTEETNVISLFNKTSDCCYLIFHGMCMGAKSLQSYPTLFDPMDCSPSGSSVHGILQARILAWVALPSSRGSSDPGIEPVSLSLLHWQAGSLPLAPSGMSDTDFIKS